MSSLDEYVENVKKYKNQHPDISEDKLIRYVYWDLGQRFTFDLKFAFGNSREKQRIYDCSRSKEDLEEAMNSNIVICKSVSYIIEYVLKKLGVNIRTVVEPQDGRRCPHIYNIVIPKDGEKYSIDLQEDMKEIQAHSFTKHYGLSTEDNKKPVLSRRYIEQMDRELGYVDEEHYYSDEYLYLLKSEINYFTNFSEKVEFVLENIYIYENKKIEYPERKWHHEKILKDLFSEKELNKIHMIDCYYEEPQERKYKNCIVVEISGTTEIYMYSIEENRYCKMTIEEFAKLVQNGLVNLQGVPRLKNALRKLKEKGDGR